MAVPDFFGDLRAGENASDILEKNLEQSEFTLGKVNRFAVDGDLAADEVHADRTTLEDSRALGGTPTSEGADARKQFVEAERLAEIIVSAEIEAFDAIFDRTARAQDEDLIAEFAVTPFPEEIKAAAIGQPKIKNDDIVFRFAEGVARLLAIRNHRNGIRRFLEALG